MSDCDCQKDIKKPINDRSTIDATAAKKPGDGRLIDIVAATTVGIFYALRAVGVRQGHALLSSTSLVQLLSFFDLMI